MEFKDVVFGRRSIRKYTEEPVSEEDLRYIMEAGLLAPSGVNLQPWYFVVIRSKEQMERLVNVMSGVSDKLVDGLNERFSKHPEVAQESIRFIKMLGGAPVVILAFRYRTDYPKTDVTIVQSIAAAMENIVLAAYDRGLGTCWMTAPVETMDDTALRDMFAPDKGNLVAMITLGHPEGEARPVARKDGRYVII